MGGKSRAGAASLAGWERWQWVQHAFRRQTGGLCRSCPSSWRAHTLATSTASWADRRQCQSLALIGLDFKNPTPDPANLLHHVKSHIQVNEMWTSLMTARPIHTTTHAAYDYSLTLSVGPGLIMSRLSPSACPLALTGGHAPHDRGTAAPLHRCTP